MKNNFWRLPIVAVVGLFLLLTSRQNTQKNEEQIRLINALKDSIRHYKNEKHNLVAKISVFEAQNKENFLNLKTKDKEVVALQELLKKEKAKVATIIRNNTNVNGNFRGYIETDSINSTVSIGYHDESPHHYIKVISSSSLKDRVVHHFYDDETNKRISHYQYGVKKGSWEYEIQIKDSLTILHKRDSLGRMYVEVENMNPYSVSPAVRSYYKTQPD